MWCRWHLLPYACCLLWHAKLLKKPAKHLRHQGAKLREQHQLVLQGFEMNRCSWLPYNGCLKRRAHYND